MELLDRIEEHLQNSYGYNYFFEFDESEVDEYNSVVDLLKNNYGYADILINHNDFNEMTNGYNEGYSAEDIKNAGKALDIAKIARLNDDKLSAFMEELKELNVLRSTDDTHYLFTRFTFFQMMGNSSEVDDKLVEYMED